MSGEIHIQPEGNLREAPDEIVIERRHYVRDFLALHGLTV
jgi:hypothetical protein